MRDYVLVLDAYNLLCPIPYSDNVLLNDSYQYYLVEKGNVYELVNKNPYDSITDQKVRCPKCMAQLVKISTNKYNCIFCSEGR
jgi:hypothetical protein